MRWYLQATSSFLIQDPPPQLVSHPHRLPSQGNVLLSAARMVNLATAPFMKGPRRPAAAAPGSEPGPLRPSHPSGLLRPKREGFLPPLDLRVVLFFAPEGLSDPSGRKKYSPWCAVFFYCVPRTVA